MGGSSGDGHAATPAWDYEVVTIVVVIGTSLLAFGLESVHHHSHRHTVASRMVEHVQTEFSLLGLVAILLMYVEVNTSISESYLHLLHEVHMVLFYIALLYLLVVLGLLALSRWVRVWWKALEEGGAITPEDAAAAEARSLTAWRSLPPWQRCCSPVSLLRLRRSQARAAYHDLRAHFVLANGLPRNFPFHKYLTSASEPVLAELTHVHPIAYVVLLLWVELDLLLRASLPADGAYAAADPPLSRPMVPGYHPAAATPASPVTALSSVSPRPGLTLGAQGGAKSVGQGGAVQSGGQGGGRRARCPFGAAEVRALY